MLRLLESHPLLQARLAALTAIAGVGTVTALTWALEVAEPGPVSFPQTSGELLRFCQRVARESAGKQKRGPLSKQRNAHLQSTLIEAAKLAPRYNPTLKTVYEKACLQRLEKPGHADRGAETDGLSAGDRPRLFRQADRFRGGLSRRFSGMADLSR